MGAGDSERPVPYDDRHALGRPGVQVTASRALRGPMSRARTEPGVLERLNGLIRYQAPVGVLSARGEPTPGSERRDLSALDDVNGEDRQGRRKGRRMHASLPGAPSVVDQLRVPCGGGVLRHSRLGRRHDGAARAAFWRLWRASAYLADRDVAPGAELVLASVLREQEVAGSNPVAPTVC
jgi:hypothetical protein